MKILTARARTAAAGYFLSSSSLEGSTSARPMAPFSTASRNASAQTGLAKRASAAVARSLGLISAHARSRIEATRMSSKRASVSMAAVCTTGG